MNAQHMNIFDTLGDIGEEEINIENFNFIPTVKYRKVIAELCEDFKKIENFHTFCPAIALNNGTMFYTSNAPNYSAIYVTSGLYRADNYFIKAYNHPGHFLITSGYYGDFLQKSVIDILQNRFHVYNSYCLIRRCDDCTVIIAISHSNQLKYPERIYHETVSAVEEITIKYFDGMINIYVDNLPGLKYSRFATDQNYRARILKTRENNKKNHLLTAREIECLYWISRGKTSKEISVLIKISEHTVNEHKKNIMKKLNVSNIIYAVREAMRAEIIT